jgi:sRNA-binding protein
MATHPDKMIPELLLKLKNALEKGESPIQKEQSEACTLNVHSLKNSSQQDRGEQSSYSNESISSNVKAKKEIMTRPIEGPKANISANPKRIPFSKNERVKTAFDWLSTTFPSVFNGEVCLPLKLGISQDIAAWKAANDTDNASVDRDINVHSATFFPTKTAIRDALSFYTHSLRYQKSILENDKRYDLNGNEAGVVDVEHKEYARQRKASIEAIIHARKIKREGLKERRKLSSATLQKEKQKKEQTD